MQYNPAGMCSSCLQNEIDITSNLRTTLTIHSCRGCGRFLLPPWQNVALESKELMSACLRKIPGLSKLKLIDAVWIWTEPHSMRLKIKLTVQKEVTNGAIMQQATVVEFVRRNQQCKNCEAYYAQGAWHAIVQVRQHVAHKRTFFYLEQLLLKHNAHSECLQIQTFKDGMDFYFKERNQALRFISFLESKIPVTTKYARKLVTADNKANIGNFKHNHVVTIAPVCKDDIMILPRELAKSLGNISQLVLVKQIAASIQVMDPFTCEHQEINCEKFFRHNIRSTMTTRQLTNFIVLSIEPVLNKERACVSSKRGHDKKSSLAECVVARERDLGANDTQFVVLTHLGNLLREGDTVLGYDLSTCPWAQDEVEKACGKKDSVPDIILVKKFTPSKKDRIWTLKKLDVDEAERLSGKDSKAMEEDYETFMQELETDKELRSNINMYKKSSTKPKTQKMDDGEGYGGDADSDEDDVHLDELLNDLSVTTGDTDREAPEISVFSREQASSIQPKVNFDTKESVFDASRYDPKDFKF